MAQNPFEGNVGLCFRQNSYAVNLRNVVLDYAFWEKVGGGAKKTVGLWRTVPSRDYGWMIELANSGWSFIAWRYLLV